MRRSTGTTVIAVLAMMGSLLFVAMSCLMVLALIVAPHHSLDQPGQPMATIGMIFAIVFFLGPAIWGLVTSVGLFRLRQWARISTLIFSGLLAFFGIVSPIFILAVRLPQPPEASPTLMSDIKISIVVFYLLLAAVGVWWLVYLTRPAVRAQFEVGYVAGPPPRRPLSISIIAWLLIAGACFFPVALALRAPLFVFGTVLTGSLGVVVLLAFCVVSITAGAGLLRLRNSARVLAIAYFIFGMVNAAVSYLLPGSAERFSRMINAMPAAFHAPAPPPFNPLALAAVSIPVMLVPIYFLVKNKRAFVEAAPTPNPPPLATT